MSGPSPWLLAGPSVALKMTTSPMRRTQGESQFVDLTCDLLKKIFNAHWNILVQGFRSLPRPPRCAYISSGVRQGGGGGIFCPPCLTPELIGAARRARQRSKALNENIPMRIKNFFERSHVRSRSGQMSRICVFGLLLMIAHRVQAINSRAPKLSQNAASLQQESSLGMYYA